jgi:hypothetical protein
LYNYGVCTLNRTQASAISFDYHLPFGKGEHYLSSRPGWVNQIAGGWEATGVLTLQTGLPFTPTISNDEANTGVGSQRPNRLGNPIMVDQPGCWFYVAANSVCQSLASSATAAFAEPASHTYGTSGRDILSANGLRELDFSLLKNFRITESKMLQFRAESFNLTNTPTYSAPSTSINVASGGVVTSTLNAAREIQLALKFYF